MGQPRKSSKRQRTQKDRNSLRQKQRPAAYAEADDTAAVPLDNAAFGSADVASTCVLSNFGSGLPPSSSTENRF